MSLTLSQVNNYKIVFGYIFFYSHKITYKQSIIWLDNKNKRDTMVVSKVNLTLVAMEQTNAGDEGRPQQLIEVGSLVYTYDLPSDPENRVRIEQGLSGKQSQYNNRQSYDDAQEYKSRSRRSILNYERLNSIGKQSNDNENEQEQQDREQYNQHHQRQHLGQWSHDEIGSELKESLYSVDENQVNYQPKPELEKAPESPLLPFFIGYKGQSIQNAEGINTVDKAEKLAHEIASDVQTPNEIPKSNTLSKFNILINVIRTMDAQQIKQLTQSMQSQKLAWKVYRDAVVEAGSAPAAIEVMQWIEDGRVTDEEAAELIAALPATIREPTEELQNRFFVSIVF